MAQILLITTGGDGADDCARIRRSAAKDLFRVHSIVDDPRLADIIMFFQARDALLSRDVRTHPYARQYTEKSFSIDPSDFPLPFLPGVYASIDKHSYNRSRVRSGFYPIVFDHEWIEYDPDGAPPELLFSFVGAFCVAAVRREIGRIHHPRSLIRDTSDDLGNDEGHSSDVYARYHREYAETVANSKFVLCPRGFGVSSLRIFETMKAGRVPVIISDDWVPPDGPAWASFSMRVREKDIRALPELLERHETSAAEWGQLARRNWEQWFSEEAAFHRIVEWCVSILQSRKIPERYMQKLVLARLLEPSNVRHRFVPVVRDWLAG